MNEVRPNDPYIPSEKKNMRGTEGITLFDDVLTTPQKLDGFC